MIPFAGLALSFLKGQWRYILIGLGILIALWTAYSWAYNRGYDTAKERGDLALAQYAQRVEEARKASEVKARAIEAQQRAEIAIIATSYEDQKRAAASKSAKVVADLRAGNLRLRREWEGCRSPGVSGTASDPGIPDDLGELRRASLGRVLGIVGECQAQVTGLQAVVRMFTKTEFVQ